MRVRSLEVDLPPGWVHLNNDLALVEPLRGLARSFTHELFYSPRGVRSHVEPASDSNDSGVSHSYGFP